VENACTSTMVQPSQLLEQRTCRPVLSGCLHTLERRLSFTALLIQQMVLCEFSMARSFSSGMAIGRPRCCETAAGLWPRRFLSNLACQLTLQDASCEVPRILTNLSI
jgi:hypothetical protein